MPATRGLLILGALQVAAAILEFPTPYAANADDYTLEPVDASHYVVDERPDVVREKLIALAAETAHA